MCLVSTVQHKNPSEVGQSYNINYIGNPAADSFEDIVKLGNTIAERVEFHLLYEDPLRARPHTIAILATCHSLTDVDTEIVDYIAHEPLKFKKRSRGGECYYHPCPQREKFIRKLINLFPDACKSFIGTEVDDD